MRGGSCNGFVWRGKIDANLLGFRSCIQSGHKYSGMATVSQIGRRDLLVIDEIFRSSQTCKCDESEIVGSTSIRKAFPNDLDGINHSIMLGPQITDKLGISFVREVILVELTSLSVNSSSTPIKMTSWSGGDGPFPRLTGTSLTGAVVGTCCSSAALENQRIWVGLTASSSWSRPLSHCSARPLGGSRLTGTSLSAAIFWGDCDRYSGLPLRSLSFG